jgi:hypothetical protein
MCRVSTGPSAPAGRARSRPTKAARVRHQPSLAMARRAARRCRTPPLPRATSGRGLSVDALPKARSFAERRAGSITLRPWASSRAAASSTRRRGARKATSQGVTSSGWIISRPRPRVGMPRRPVRRSGWSARRSQPGGVEQHAQRLAAHVSRARDSDAHPGMIAGAIGRASPPPASAHHPPRARLPRVGRSGRLRRLVSQAR